MGKKLTPSILRSSAWCCYITFCRVLVCGCLLQRHFDPCFRSWNSDLIFLTTFLFCGPEWMSCLFFNSLCFIERISATPSVWYWQFHLIQCLLWPDVNAWLQNQLWQYHLLSSSVMFNIAFQDRHVFFSFLTSLCLYFNCKALEMLLFLIFVDWKGILGSDWALSI